MKLSRVLSAVLCFSMVFACKAMPASAEEETAVGATPTRISVTVNGDSATSKGIVWYTKEKTESVVQIETEDHCAVENCTITCEDVYEWNGEYVHKALVTDLSPGTSYLYRVGNGTDLSDCGSFVTDNGDSKVEFLAIADIQASSYENFDAASKVVRAAFDAVPAAEFMINLGDFTNNCTNEQWDYYYQTMKDVNINTTLVPVAGNHDGDDAEYWFTNMFNLDTTESVETKNGVNYSFDYGNIHFAVLNNNDCKAISLAQLNWLKNDLNGTDKDWKIVCMHKAPYTLGKHGKKPDGLYLQKSLTGVFEECNVDLVLTGHDHQYLRTKPLAGNKVDEENGVIYVLAGTAGTKRYQIRDYLEGHYIKNEWINALTVQKAGYGNYWNGSDWNQTSENNVGGIFNAVCVDGGTLTYTSYVLTDAPNAQTDKQILTVNDTFTLTKKVGQNKITFTGDNTTSREEYENGIFMSYAYLSLYVVFDWLPKFICMLPGVVPYVIREKTW